MQYKSAFIAVAIAASVAAQPSFAAEKQPLEIFGVALKGATRDQMRQAVKKNGLVPVREHNSAWVDLYKAEGVLEGATEFQAGYVMATGKFAYAEYKFPAFVDTKQVGKVVDMVTAKYGKPAAQQGDYSVGEVTAKWNVGHGMQVVVYRGWPDTTTYLRYVDPSARLSMNAEIEAENRAATAETAKAQNKAF